MPSMAAALWGASAWLGRAYDSLPRLPVIFDFVWDGVRSKVLTFLLVATFVDTLYLSGLLNAPTCRDVRDQWAIQGGATNGSQASHVTAPPHTLHWHPVPTLPGSMVTAATQPVVINPLSIVDFTAFVLQPGDFVSAMRWAAVLVAAVANAKYNTELWLLPAAALATAFVATVSAVEVPACVAIGRHAVVLGQAQAAASAAASSGGNATDMSLVLPLSLAATGIWVLITQRMLLWAFSVAAMFILWVHAAWACPRLPTAARGICTAACACTATALQRCRPGDSRTAGRGSATLRSSSHSGSRTSLGAATLTSEPQGDGGGDGLGSVRVANSLAATAPPPTTALPPPQPFASTMPTPMPQLSPAANPLHGAADRGMEGAMPDAANDEQEGQGAWGGGAHQAKLPCHLRCRHGCAVLASRIGAVPQRIQVGIGITIIVILVVSLTAAVELGVLASWTGTVLTDPNLLRHFARSLAQDIDPSGATDALVNTLLTVTQVGVQAVDALLRSLLAGVIIALVLCLSHLAHTILVYAELHACYSQPDGFDTGGGKPGVGDMHANPADSSTTMGTTAAGMGTLLAAGGKGDGSAVSAPPQRVVTGRGCCSGGCGACWVGVRILVAGALAPLTVWDCPYGRHPDGRVDFACFSFYNALFMIPFIIINMLLAYLLITLIFAAATFVLLFPPVRSLVFNTAMATSAAIAAGDYILRRLVLNVCLTHRGRITWPRLFLFLDFVVSTTVGLLSGLFNTLIRVVVGSLWSAFRCIQLHEPLLPGPAAMLDSGWMVHGAVLKCCYAAGNPIPVARWQ